MIAAVAACLFLLQLQSKLADSIETHKKTHKKEETLGTHYKSQSQMENA